MVLNKFENGLNTREAEELIHSTECVIANNVSLDSGQLVSAKGPGDAYTSYETAAFFASQIDKLLPNGNIRDYLEYQSKVYYTDGATAKKIIADVTYDLGIEQPSAAPVTTLNTSDGKLTGTLQYVYTYYNVTDGTESQPSPISPELVADKSSVSLTLVPSTDPQVSHIKIYRIGGSFTKFIEVKEVANIQGTQTDNLIDSKVFGKNLSSKTNGKPIVGLRYLVQSRQTFFAAKDAKLYFTRDIGNPNYWPETSYIDFKENITGLAVVNQGLLVFTKHETHIVIGSNSSTFVTHLISRTQGCLSNASIVNSSSSVIFISNDGICVTSGSSITVLTKHKLGKQLFEVTSAVLLDEVYYAQLKNRSIIAYEMRYNKNIILNYYFLSSWLVVIDDKLYGEIGLELVELFAGPQIGSHYKTGKFTDGSSSQLKSYSDIYVSAIGGHDMTVYIDGLNVLEVKIQGEVKPEKFSVPMAKRRGTSIQFELKGKGTIKEIEYKVEGRENG